MTVYLAYLYKANWIEWKIEDSRGREKECEGFILARNKDLAKEYLLENKQVVNLKEMDLVDETFLDATGGDR